MSRAPLLAMDISPALCMRLAENGYRAVRKEFDIRLTIERVERYLQGVLAHDGDDIS